METSNNFSQKNLRTLKIETCTRTLDEVVVEVQEIVAETDCVESCLTRLKSNGYQYEHCWVKNGSIGTIWYMKRKKVLRIQVSNSELCGDYHKAYCVVVPITDVELKESDSSRVRHFPINQNLRFGKTTSITENMNKN